ncbi:MAG: hypothetical protein EOO88_00015 [Pedobacter sp.]|nr:MAG: hypothetical protein EOO88_00015 [Pedobacter sp.]
MLFKTDQPYRSNLYYAVIGAAVGLLINLGVWLIGSVRLNARGFCTNMLFSVLITVIIANIVMLFLKHSKLDLKGFWKFIPVFYLCNALGMIVGVEISHLLTCIFFGVPFSFFSSPDVYRQCSILVIVIGTTLLLYQMQRLREVQVVDLQLLTKRVPRDRKRTLKVKLPIAFYELSGIISGMLESRPLEAESAANAFTSLLTQFNDPIAPAFHTIGEEAELIESYASLSRYQPEGFNVTLELPPALWGRIIPRFLLLMLIINRSHLLGSENGTFYLSLNHHEDKLRVDFNVAETSKDGQGWDFLERSDIGVILNGLYNRKVFIQRDFQGSGKCSIFLPLI